MENGCKGQKSRRRGRKKETRMELGETHPNFIGLCVGRSLFKLKKFSNVEGTISKFDIQKQIVMQINPSIIYTKSHPESIKDRIDLNILHRRKNRMA